MTRGMLPVAYRPQASAPATGELQLSTLLEISDVGSAPSGEQREEGVNVVQSGHGHGGRMGESRQARPACFRPKLIGPASSQLRARACWSVSDQRSRLLNVARAELWSRKTRLDVGSEHCAGCAFLLFDMGCFESPAHLRWIRPGSSRPSRKDREYGKGARGPCLVGAPLEFRGSETYSGHVTTDG